MVQHVQWHLFCVPNIQKSHSLKYTIMEYCNPSHIFNSYDSLWMAIFSYGICIFNMQNGGNIFVPDRACFFTTRRCWLAFRCPFSWAQPSTLTPSDPHSPSGSYTLDPLGYHDSKHKRLGEGMWTPASCHNRLCNTLLVSCHCIGNVFTSTGIWARPIHTHIAA